MNKLYIFGCIAAALFFSCSHSHETTQESEKESHNHDEEIVLHTKDAEKFGVRTITVATDTFNEIISASGQVLNSPSGLASIVAPKSGQIKFASGIMQGCAVKQGQSIASVSSAGVSGGDADKSAKARLDAAKKELDRLTPLLTDGIITKREYNAAKAEYDQARAEYSPAAASGASVSPISGTLTEMLVKTGDFVSAGQPVATVATDAELTLEIQVPAHMYPYVAAIESANIRLTGSDNWISTKELGGTFKGKAPQNNSSGYVSLYFTLNNTGDIMPGSFVDVRLRGAQRNGVLTVPATSVTEQQGAKFVYVKIDSDGYEKLPVTIGQSDGKSIEILSGLTPGMEIVSEGVTFVRLAETSGNVPEGHSHNH